MRILIPALLCSILPTPRPSAAQDVELPIREITLYRSGVGAFSRTARIEGDATVRLRFPTDDVNDILKSMTILDLGDGTIGPASYGSKEPLARRLASFGVDISNAPSIDGLFRSLRGARLRVQTADGPREGKILGVEDRTIVEGAGEEAVVVTRPHVNLLTSSGVRTIDIAAVVSFDLLDETLAEELRLALAEQREERMKSVELSFIGRSARDVLVSYVREMPVWKTSYRLIVSNGKGAADASDTLTLQGFAIIENTTDDEWSDVRLSLASGRPVGFTMDLYQPIYAARPDIPVPLDHAIAPKLYESEGRIREEMKGEMARFASLDRLALAMDPSPAESSMDVFADAAPGNNSWGADGKVVQADGLGDAQASGGEVGGQFHYTVDTPVSLERQRSAMLPIVLKEIEGRRLSILSVDDPTRAPEHPMQGVELSNDTGLHLMPGPIAVFDGGAYAGDSQIDHIARGQRRLLTFAMDIDVECRTRATVARKLVSVKIADGLLISQSRQTRERTYELVNYDAKRARTVLIEYPKSGWELVTPGRPDDETTSLYRFEVQLPADGTASQTVVEEHVENRRMAVTSLDPAALLEIHADGKVSAAVLEAVKHAAALQADEHRHHAAIERLDAERQTIGHEQDRIRKNMERLQQNSELHRRYLAKLGVQEDRLEAIARERSTADSDAQKARQALATYLQDLTIE